jgi:hypothetical protein
MAAGKIRQSPALVPEIQEGTGGAVEVPVGPDPIGPLIDTVCIDTVWSEPI